MSKRGGRRNAPYEMKPNIAKMWGEHVDRVFLRSVDDVERACAVDQMDPMVSTGAAGVIRLLLVDQHPLVNVVRGRHRVAAPTFRARLQSHEQQFVPGTQRLSRTYLQLECLDPVVECADPVQTFTRDSWLKHQVGSVEGQSITVRDLVQYTALQHGGVHIGAPDSLKAEMIFYTIAATTNYPDGNAQHALLRAVGRVTAAGLQPLVSAVRDAA